MIRRPTTEQVLDELADDGVISDSLRSELAQIPIDGSVEHAPWFVRLLIGIGAWVAAGLFLLFLFLSEIVTSEGNAVIVGLILVAATTVLRRVSSHDFWAQLSMAGSVAGQILGIGGVVLATESVSGGALFALCLELVLLAVYPDTVMRFLTTVGIAGSIFVIALQVHEPFLVDLVTVFALAGGGLLWLAPPRWEMTRFWGHRLPMAYGFLLFGLGLLVANAIVAKETYQEPWMLLQPTTLGLGIFFSLFSLSVFRTYGVRLASEPAIVSLVAIGLICAATSLSPGIIASLVVFALAFQRRSTVLLGLACVFLVGFVVFFYYSLNTTLLAKSGMLFGSGLILFALRCYLRMRWRVLETQTP